MLRAKSICRRIGCNALIPSPGFCSAHKQDEKRRFDTLKKAPGSRAFYQGRKWTRTSVAYRRENPLCAEHKRRGLVVKGDLTDHIIERHELEARGLNPYDFEYLQTLCHACHNKKLRERKERNNVINNL